jgi:hypothetical protein
MPKRLITSGENSRSDCRTGCARDQRADRLQEREPGISGRGGASLIEEAIRQAWPLAPERIEVIGDPQLALAREIALYNKED